jgi:hypothetical protein
MWWEHAIRSILMPQARRSSAAHWQDRMIPGCDESMTTSSYSKSELLHARQRLRTCHCSLGASTSVTHARIWQDVQQPGPGCSQGRQGYCRQVQERHDPRLSTIDHRPSTIDHRPSTVHRPAWLQSCRPSPCNPQKKLPPLKGPTSHYVLKISTINAPFGKLSELPSPRWNHPPWNPLGLSPFS